MFCDVDVYCQVHTVEVSFLESIWELEEHPCSLFSGLPLWQGHTYLWVLCLLLLIYSRDMIEKQPRRAAKGRAQGGHGAPVFLQCCL